MVTRIQLRRDSAANWTSTNPILDQGEPGYEISSSGSLGNLKIGDGSSRWSQLPYHSGLNGYVPIASNSSVGGIQIGAGLTINGAGVVSAYVPTAATISSQGLTQLGPVLGAYQSVAQTGSSGITVNGTLPTYTTVTYDQVPVNPTVGSYNPSTGVYTLGRPGYYQINANVTIDNGPIWTISGNTQSPSLASVIGIGVLVNGATLLDFNVVPGAYGLTTPTISTLMLSTTGADTIQIVANAATNGTSPTPPAHVPTVVASGMQINQVYFSVLSIIYLRPL